MSTTLTATAFRPPGSSLPPREKVPLEPVNLEEMLVGEESDEASDSEDDNKLSSDDEGNYSEFTTDVLMREPDEESDDDDEYEYTAPPARSAPVKRRISKSASRESAKIESTKKKIGVSLPKPKPLPAEPIDLDKMLEGDESDEYIESGSEDGESMHEDDDGNTLTVLLYGDGSASDAPDDDKEDDTDGDWPGPQGRKTRSSERALRVAREAAGLQA